MLLLFYDEFLEAIFVQGKYLHFFFLLQIWIFSIVQLKTTKLNVYL